MSNSLVKLDSYDFKLRQTPKGLMMGTEINGLSIIMFYAPKDPNCREIWDKFMYLPKVVQGITFGVVNLTENFDIVELSNKTQATKIKFVPYIVAYINGNPVVSYNQGPDLKELQLFSKRILQSYNSRNTVNVSNPHSLQQRQVQRQHNGSEQPYSLPQSSEALKGDSMKGYYDFVCDGNFCYMEMGKAYTGETMAPQ